MTDTRRAVILCGLAALALLALTALALPSGAPARAAQPELTPTATATATPTPDTPSAAPIACGQTVADTTVGATNTASQYACAPWLPLTGPERVYSLRLDAAADVDLLLGGMSSDLDLLLLTGQNPSSCIAHGDNAISAHGLTAGLYYLVVDGFDGAAGPYQLSVWCPLAVTPTVTPTATPTATPRPPLLKQYLPLLLHSAEARR